MRSISNPAMQPLGTLGGALLCSLALIFAYFLVEATYKWKISVGGCYFTLYFGLGSSPATGGYEKARFPATSDPAPTIPGK